jgi:hypothetical protein
MALFQKHKTFRTFEDTLSENPHQIREVTLAYLRSHRSWYAFWSRTYTLTWNIATFSIIVLGALTSILTAFGQVSKILLIILPAISSLLGAFLVQFRLRDMWRLREMGRIAVEELICKAYLLPVDDPQTALKEAIELRLNVHKLERDQLSEYFRQPTDQRTTDNGTHREAVGTGSDGAALSSLAPTHR